MAVRIPANVQSELFAAREEFELNFSQMARWLGRRHGIKITSAGLKYWWDRREERGETLQ